MKKQTIPVLLLLLSLLFVNACTPPPPPPPPEPEEIVPVEPTAEEHYGQIKGTVSALLTPGIIAPPDDVIQGMLSQIQGRRMQLVATENGRLAVQMLTRDVDDAIRQAREEERYRKALALCKLHGALQPGNDRYAKLMEYADIMVSRPNIIVTGFVDIDGKLYAFLDVFDPKAGLSWTYRVSEGEEFHPGPLPARCPKCGTESPIPPGPAGHEFYCRGPGNTFGGAAGISCNALVKKQTGAPNLLRLVGIIGNQQSIEVEYLPVRHMWTIDGPRGRTRGGA